MRTTPLESARSHEADPLEHRSRVVRDRGASTVEYALGLALGALIAFTAVQFAAQQTGTMFETVMNETERPEVDQPTPPTTVPTTTSTTTCRRWCR